MKETFFCGHCRDVICTDCQQIAEEYAELYARQRSELAMAQQELKAVQRELKLAHRSRDDYKRVLELGVAPQMLAWMRSLSPASFRKAVEREAAEL